MEDGWGGRRGFVFCFFVNKQTPKSAQISFAVIDRTSCFSVAFAQVAFTVGPAAGHRSSRHRGLEHLNSI